MIRRRDSVMSRPRRAQRNVCGVWPERQECADSARAVSAVLSAPFSPAEPPASAEVGGEVRKRIMRVSGERQRCRRGAFEYFFPQRCAPPVHGKRQADGKEAWRVPLPRSQAEVQVCRRDGGERQCVMRAGSEVSAYVEGA